MLIISCQVISYEIPLCIILGMTITQSDYVRIMEANTIERTADIDLEVDIATKVEVRIQVQVTVIAGIIP